MKRTYYAIIAILIGRVFAASAGDESDQIPIGYFSTAYSNATIYVGARTNAELMNIVIFELPAAEDGEQQKRISAKRGTVIHEEGARVEISLYDVHIDICRTAIGNDKSQVMMDSSEALSQTNITLWVK